MRSDIVNKEQIVLRANDPDGRAIVKYYYPIYPRGGNYVAIKLYLPPRARYVRIYGWSDSWNGTGPFLYGVTRMSRYEFESLYREIAELIRQDEHARAIRRFEEVYNKYFVEVE